MLRLVRFDHVNPEEVRLDASPTKEKGVILLTYSMKFSEGMEFELDNTEAKILAQALNNWLEEPRK